MRRKKQDPHRNDELLDELLSDCQSPEEILGESGLLKQLTKRLVERALAGELTHHLNPSAAPEPSLPQNSRDDSGALCAGDEYPVFLFATVGSLRSASVTGHHQRSDRCGQ